MKKTRREDRHTWRVEAVEKIGQLHAIPTDDGFNHVPRTQCLCGPRLEAEAEGVTMYVHFPRKLAN